MANQMICMTSSLLLTAILRSPSLPRISPRWSTLHFVDSLKTQARRVSLVQAACDNSPRVQTTIWKRPLGHYARKVADPLGSSQYGSDENV
jgi:hypothetical protein